MEGTIETQATTVSLRGGYLHIVSKGFASTAESVGETIAAASTLSEGAPLPVLFDARQWPGGDTDSWITVIKEMMSAFSVAAILVDEQQVPPNLATHAASVDRLLIPFRVFTDGAEARAFLASYLPGQSLE